MYTQQIRGTQRHVTVGDPVKAYYNLNKDNVFSLVAKDGKYKNKVVAYARQIALRDCYFSVNQSGLARARDEGQRNVHAYCHGILVSLSQRDFDYAGQDIITYNPFTTGKFEQTSSHYATKDRYSNLVLSNGRIYVCDK
jgi:hypothetical protein